MNKLQYPELRPLLERVVGYLTFSSGSIEPAFFSALNELIDSAAAKCRETRVATYTRNLETKNPETGREADRESSVLSPALQLTYDILVEATERLGNESAAFSDCRQSRRLCDLVFGRVLREYREFHRDLLFHVSPEDVFQPFFIGRCFEVLLTVDDLYAEDASIIDFALTRLNDYVGYRPVATLEQVLHTTYRHERFRPVPLFIKGAGVASGCYQRIITQCLEILKATDSSVSSDAYFDLANLQELALDIRAYDFDHPVNKRPNYHFGLWDPDQIDANGNYCRFIIHQIMLDSLMKRLTNGGDRTAEECEFEIAGTLAGTILMGSGVSGSGPDSHDSTVTLSSLMPIIANYRDDFYDWLLDSVHGSHRANLEKEIQEKRQPFGGVRQHLNAELASRRAMQVQHVQLAKIYAKMGYADAATRQAAIVPVASARILCQIDCLLSSATDACLARRLRECLSKLQQIEQWLLRGIECGAIIDPWCLLGFDGNFPLFPAIENSVPDHRADDLVGIVEHTLDIYSHLLAETAACDEPELFADVKNHFTRLVDWWRKYAAHEISALQAIDTDKTLKAAEHVAEALRLWKQAGSAAGDIAFWARYADIFNSPKAYQLVIDALLERKDIVASRALLVHWLSRGSWIGLVEGETSYHELVLAWLGLQQERYTQATLFDEREEVWQQVCKFYDFLEANAESYWQVPDFEIPAGSPSSASGNVDPADADFDSEAEDEDEDEIDDDEPDELFGAAYDQFVFTDSADDGVEGPIYETDTSKQDALESEADRLIDRLSFLNTLAILWFEASNIPLPVLSVDELNPHQQQQLRQRMEVLENWISQAEHNRVGLAGLLNQVMAMRLPKGNGEVSALMEYDRLRLIKETLLDRIANTSVEMQMAVTGLKAIRHGLTCLLGDALFGDAATAEKESPWVLLFAGILTRNKDWVDQVFSQLVKHLADQPLLYVPLSRGGNPDELVATRLRQQCFQRSLASLPLLGMFQATVQLLKLARAMERRNTVGFGAVTEYDEMFRNGFCSMVQALIVAASDPAPKLTKKAKTLAEDRLFRQLEQLTESMLSAWLTHSRTLRLSVLEKTLDKDSWEQLVKFVKRYGGQIFTQDFLNMGNIRAILHQGVETWLRQLQESNQELDLELLNDLDHEVSVTDASRYLGVVLEAVLENFSEYRDYNSTTTQSDRGDLIYTFMDFLRLRTKYDRVAWHLKPVVWAHQVLVKNQINNVARRWRRQLTDRVDGEAERYLSELKKLQVKYSMRMPTVADRLSERFVQPLQIDRLCALVRPAIHEEDRTAAQAAFDLLEKEAESLTQQPMGVGLEVPAWLIMLEQEADLQRVTMPSSYTHVPESLIDPLPLSCDLVQSELDQLADI